jgi:hypothetical protein
MKSSCSKNANGGFVTAIKAVVMVAKVDIQPVRSMMHLAGLGAGPDRKAI